MQIFLIRVKLCRDEGCRLWGLLYGVSPITYLEWQCLLHMNQTVLQNIGAKLTHKCIFFWVLWTGVCVCAPTVCAGTNDAACVVRVGLSVNTQRPQELPRAQRTASVCVLVPSKQGNLENTKGAANKHNLIPPSSSTWLWILHCRSKNVSVAVLLCALKSNI